MTSIHRGGALVLAPLLLLTAACGVAADIPFKRQGAEAERLATVSTAAPITSIEANIAGDKASISGIAPEGTNSHTSSRRSR